MINWIVTAALKQRTHVRGKSLLEKAFGMLLPGGLQSRALSRLDMAGVGRLFHKDRSIFGTDRWSQPVVSIQMPSGSSSWLRSTATHGL